MTRPSPTATLHNLTLLDVDHNLADGAIADWMMGSSTDGHYVYMVVNGQMISGRPLLGRAAASCVWHDGTLRYIGPVPKGVFQDELLSGGTDPVLTPRQARVTPDGRFLLFSAVSGGGLRAMTTACVRDGRLS